jgi:ketosteroid isomerase-like protein
MIAAAIVIGSVAAPGFAWADGADELRALVEARFAANAANDRAFYERLLAPNAIVLQPRHPPLTGRQYLDEEFAGRAPGGSNPKASVTSFRAYVSGDTGVATYDASEPAPLGEQTFEVRTSRVDTYVRLDGAWRLLSMAVVEAVSWPDVATVDAKVLQEYAGTYRVSAGIAVEIGVQGGHLVQAMTGQPTAELWPENATTFFDRTDSPLARTVFERDAAGRVIAQVYRAMGQKIRAAKVR